MYFYVFLDTKSYDELLSLSVYCRDRINPYMFTYALSVVIIHRPDTRNLRLPSHSEMFPSLYMDSAVFSRAREESAVVQAGSRVSVISHHGASISIYNAVVRAEMSLMDPRPHLKIGSRSVVGVFW